MSMTGTEVRLKLNQHVPNNEDHLTMGGKCQLAWLPRYGKPNVCFEESELASSETQDTGHVNGSVRQHTGHVNGSVSSSVESTGQNNESLQASITTIAYEAFRFLFCYFILCGSIGTKKLHW